MHNIYIRDFFGSLGGTPDIGRDSDFGNEPITTKARRRALRLRTS